MFIGLLSIICTRDGKARFLVHLTSNITEKWQDVFLLARQAALFGQDICCRLIANCVVFQRIQSPQNGRTQPAGRGLNAPCCCFGAFFCIA